MKIENINEVEDCLEHLKKIKKAKELINFQDAKVIIATDCGNVWLTTIIDEYYLKSAIKKMLEKKEDEITKRLKKL